MNTYNVKFINNEHTEFFKSCLGKQNIPNDTYHAALFYTLGLTNETRNNISDIYDFKEREIKFDGLRKGWQTGTSLKVTRLAFNLFNGFAGDEGDNDTTSAGDYTPYYLFDTSLMIYMFEAIKIRYPNFSSLQDDV